MAWILRSGLVVETYGLTFVMRKARSSKWVSADLSDRQNEHHFVLPAHQGEHSMKKRVKPGFNSKLHLCFMGRYIRWSWSAFLASHCLWPWTIALLHTTAQTTFMVEHPFPFLLPMNDRTITCNRTNNVYYLHFQDVWCCNKPDLGQPTQNLLIHLSGQRLALCRSRCAGTFS